ncbi:cold-regulated 413 inner membrane protein 1 [Carex littledalei]|uniref:Cold-regulated 413 inner membrane protein 1 n=1 Tax=Carex littledalei TaxID=544730 RepID=A0A833QUQ2_9POAL|nr:cold-regulated 413 inner membrane protein 1 [Carex littledalei]
MTSLRLSLPSKSLSTPSISHLKVGRNRASVSLFHGIPIRSPLANPLRIGSPMKERKRDTVVCASASVNARTLQWVSAVSAGILMVTRGTTIQKSFLVPLFAVQAPASIIGWIKGEYGMWTAFLTLLIRLFYFIPGELDLPFLTMLFVITAPYQAISLRGTQGGAIIALAIAAYLAFQHFSRLGNLRKAFDHGSIIATLAIICITVVPFFFLF